MRGEVLKRALFRLAVAEGIHMKKNRKGTEDIWVSFTALLFKQPEFAGLEGSSNSVYTKYTDTLNEIARHHGWKDENGEITGNLSGHEGDLDDLDANVKQILMDKEDKKAQEELKKIQAGEINDIEKDVLTARLQAQAKEKRGRGSEQRKVKGGSPSSTSSTTSSVTSASHSVDDLFSAIFTPGRDKKARVTVDDDVTEKLTDFFEKKNMQFEAVVGQAGLSAEGEGCLYVASMDIAFHVFCNPAHVSDVDYFKSQMITYGMNALDAHKLFLWIKRFHKDFLKESGTHIDEGKTVN